MQAVEWKNFRLKMNESYGSHANGGRLPKYWLHDELTGRQFLIKSSRAFSYEPFCEKMAYIIGKDLGLDVLEYDIIDARLFKDVLDINPFCKYLSICERIDRKDYFITSIAEIKRARNFFISDKDKKITNKEVMYELLPKDYIDRLILFDAIIGNNDRHYGNIHLLRGIDGAFRPAPIIDNGASLLADAPLIETFLFKNKIIDKENYSSMIFRNHDSEVDTINTLTNVKYNIPYKTIEILNDIECVLKLMNKHRADAIRMYIALRLQKYLNK